MILNNSRAEFFRACPQLAYNTDELNLTPHRTAQPLLVGSAFHAALSLINSKTGTIDEACEASEADYIKRSNWSNLLKEERAIAQEDIKLVRAMVRVYGENYREENYQVLAPEVSFRVALPNTLHHCRYFHNMLHEIAKNAAAGSTSSNMLFAELVKLGKFPSIYNPFDAVQYYANHPFVSWPEYQVCQQDMPCWQPHYLVGTTDAIIQWNRAVWLMEHKTTAYDLYNDSPQSKNWIANWALSTQASTYIYGIWKSIGVKPTGVLLNVVIKPRKNAVTPVFNFYREAFLRTEEQLLRFERQISLLATDYESRMASGDVWMNPHSCFNYNRRCDFHRSCTSGVIQTGEFTTREPDYVRAAYYKVLGIEPPTPVKEEVTENNVI